jgi:short-subunit dehydrogenase
MTTHSPNSRPSAIIVGASSGIGRALARIVANSGYRLGITARRTALLEELRSEILATTPDATVVIQTMDVERVDEAMRQMQALIDTLGHVELVIINAGVGNPNLELAWEKEAHTIAINATGFAALATVAMHHFEQQRAGHLVGISSIAALRGIGHNPAYSASKAFMSNYLEALRHRVGRASRKQPMPIVITDIKPGFVDTPMTKDNPNMFWVASEEKAARQIYQAIARKRSHAYITKRWRLAAWVFRLLPDWLYFRI